MLHYEEFTGFYFFNDGNAPWHGKHHARRLLSIIDAHLTDGGRL